jgi:hypothetical protein
VRACTSANYPEALNSLQEIEDPHLTFRLLAARTTTIAPGRSKLLCFCFGKGNHCRCWWLSSRAHCRTSRKLSDPIRWSGIFWWNRKSMSRLEFRLISYELLDNASRHRVKVFLPRVYSDSILLSFHEFYSFLIYSSTWSSYNSRKEFIFYWSRQQ